MNSRALLIGCSMALAALTSLASCQRAPEPRMKQEMKTALPDAPIRHTYRSFDGQNISYLEAGEGPTVVLLHGFMSSGQQNYFSTGIAPKIAAAGYRVIVPDLRGHGQSQVKDAPDSWPADAAARDIDALVKHLGAMPHAIVGYSYGALTALRYQVLTRQAERLVLGGIGASAADPANTDRNDQFAKALDMVAAGEDNAFTKRIKLQMQVTGGTLAGYRGALSSRLYTDAALLRGFDLPVMVLTGDKDFDNGSGPYLAAIIPGAAYGALTGTHLTAVLDPAFPEQVIGFLDKE